MLHLATQKMHHYRKKPQEIFKDKSLHPQSKFFVTSKQSMGWWRRGMFKRNENSLGGTIMYTLPNAF